MGATDEISHLTNACASLIAECQSVPTLAKDDWIGKRLADFNLWAAGIRASTTGHASLDYRVRDRPDVKNVLLGILGAIKESAEQCLDANMTPTQASYGKPLSAHSKMGLDKPWSDFSDSTDASSSQRVSNDGPLATEMGDISHALNQLYRITLLIQKSGKKHRFKRADREMPSRKNDEDFIQLQKHLEFIILLGQQDVRTESWKAKDYDELMHNVTMSSSLTPIHHALVKANMVRRNRIRYATQHLVEQKDSAAITRSSAKPTGPDTGDHIPPVAEASSTHNLVQLGGGNSDVQSGDQPSTTTVTDGDVSGVQPTVNAPMTATEIDTLPLMSSRRGVDNNGKGTVVTRITRIGLRQDYPPCPKGLSTFPCPYCAQALSGDYRDMPQWRGHVKQDLMPYTCVFENCKSLEEHELFQSSEEWMAHLVDTHSETAWVCSLCPAGPDGNDEVLFDSNVAWQNHNRDAHPETFPAHQLDQLAGMSERTSLPPMACPFCRHYDETEAQPYDHIASHLHEFALRALPWSENPNGGSHFDSVASAQSEAGLGIMSRSTIHNDVDDISEDDEPPMSRSDAMNQLLEQISCQAATNLRLEVPDIAQGYQRVLEQLPTLLERARTLGLHLTSEDQQDDENIVSETPIPRVESEDKHKDRLDGYMRPLLRIQGIVHAFSEQVEHTGISEREAKELEESLQDECAALRQLLDGENAPHETKALLTSVSESPMATVSEIQELIKITREQHPWTKADSPESHPFFEEAFLAHTELMAAGLELHKRFQTGYVARCEVEAVERTLSEVFADWEEQSASAQRLRGVFDGFSKSAVRPDRFFALLPVSDLAESICGGIVTIATSICKQRSSAALVSRSTDSLTTISSAVTTGLSLFDTNQSRQNSQKLRKETAALCAAIFRLLTAVIGEITRRPPLNLDVITHLDADDTTERLSEQVRTAFSNLRFEANHTLPVQLDLLSSKVMKMNDLEKHIKKVFEREETMNLLYELLRSEIGQTHEILAKAIWTEKQTELHMPNTKNTEEVLGAEAIYNLGAQTDLVDETTRRILEHFRRCHSATDDILHLLNNKTLRNFIKSRNSSVLLIRDDGQPQQRGYLGVSFATATIVQWLREDLYPYSNSRVYTLAFFCNNPISFQRRYSSRDIMIQLVPQMMLQYQGLTLAILDYNSNSLQKADTDSLLELFARLLLHLPPRSRVYCVIDGFDPSSKSGNENDELLASLLKLTWQSFSKTVTVKLLFTSSKSAMGFRRYLDAREILEMGLLKRGGARGPAHSVMAHHTAVGKVLEKVLAR